MSEEVPMARNSDLSFPFIEAVFGWHVVNQLGDIAPAAL